MTAIFETARQGEATAIKSVTDNLTPRLRKMAAYYARCTAEDPDDLLQEAWVGLLEALPNLDVQIGSPEQYLLQRARWRMLDSVKRARVRRCLPLEDCLEGAVIADHSPGALHVSEFAGRLTDTQRRILGYLMLGLTWRETGDRMGCSSANIAYHMRAIRKEYSDWNGGDD